MHSERGNSEEEKYLNLEYRNNVLHFNGLNLENFLNKQKTPIFIFSQDILEKQYNKVMEVFSSLNTDSLAIAFSLKSNSLPEVAQTFAELDSHFEVTSKGEIKHVIENGGNPRKIIYTNIVKTPSSIRFAIGQGIELFAVDSWSDMINIERVCRSLKEEVDILVRINPGIQLSNTLFSCSGQKSKIGIQIPDNLNESSLFKSVLTHCLTSEWLSFQGLHVHLGSQIVILDQYREGMRKVSHLISQIEKLDIVINVLDIGGGFPVDYGMTSVPSISEFRDVIQEIFNGQLLSKKLILESGRYFTAPSCVLAFKVSVIKEIDPLIHIVCLDGSFYNTIPDVIFADWNFPIKKVKIDVNSQITPYIIVGSTNDTLDSYNAKNEENPFVNLRKLKENDNLVFLQAGAYSISYNSTYCMEERPLVHFIHSDGEKGKN